MKNYAIRYDCINSDGEQEPFSGVFLSHYKKKEWMQKHGVKHMARGVKLIEVVFQLSEKQEKRYRKHKYGKKKHK